MFRELKSGIKILIFSDILSLHCLILSMSGASPLVAIRMQDYCIDRRQAAPPHASFRYSHTFGWWLRTCTRTTTPHERMREFRYKHFPESAVRVRWRVQTCFLRAFLFRSLVFTASVSSLSAHRCWYCGDCRNFRACISSVCV